jgi:INO80 complex subunit B
MTDKKMNYFQTEGAKDKSRLPSSQDKKTKKLRTIEDTFTPEQPAKVQRESSSDPVRKSRRIAKKSNFDSEFDEEYDASTLENLGASNVNDGRDSKNKGGSNSKNNASKKDRSRSTVYEVDNDFATPQSNRDGKKRLRDNSVADADNTEEEMASDSELEPGNKKQKAVTESPANVKIEPLTTRRRALQSWMDGNSNSTVEFPDGLPAASSRSTYCLY